MTVVLDAHLPDGYEDPADPYYVPPYLREHYWVSEYAWSPDELASILHQTNLRIAAGLLASAVFMACYRRDPTDTVEDQATLADLTRQFLTTTDDDLLIDYLGHRLALTDARRRLLKPLDDGPA